MIQKLNKNGIFEIQKIHRNFQAFKASGMKIPVGAQKQLVSDILRNI